jgi:uncharacterized protein YkwD
MALCVDWNDIEDFDSLDWETTQGLAFASMVIGMGSITEKNYVEFYTRLMMWRHVSGHWADLTLDVVKARIGMKMNVSDTTPLKWNKRLGEIARDRVVQEMQEAVSELHST